MSILFPYNYHTHSDYCDGSSSPEEYVLSAIGKGMKATGFSSHAPVPFENNYAIQNIDRLKQYCREVRGLRRRYRESIDIFLGLEADYIPGITLDFHHFLDNFKLDYIIGSVHLVKCPGDGLWFIDGPDRGIWKNGLEKLFDNNAKKAVTTYYRQIMEMISTQQPDIVGHLDKIKMHNQGEHFSEDETWYRQLVSETLEVIRNHQVIVEVNTRGIYKKRSETLFPDLHTLKQMQHMRIPVTISSDAHKPEEVNLLINETAALLKETGYGEIYIFERGWKAMPIG